MNFNACRQDSSCRLECSMSRIYLTRVDPTKNMARFYAMSLQVTLFAECSLVREWGRIGNAGQVRETHHTTPQEAQALSEQILKRKLRKGYELA